MTTRRPLPTIAPCPCGHTRTEITKSNTSGLFSVWCKCCWIGPAEKTKRSAILAWNRRASDAEAERRTLTTPMAMTHICRELQADPGYRIGWVANIAMKFVDRMPNNGYGSVSPISIKELHEIANTAASEFIDLLCYCQKQSDEAAIERGEVTGKGAGK